MSSLNLGFSPSALDSFVSFGASDSLNVALPGAKSTYDNSGPPPNRAPMAANGAVTIFFIRSTTKVQINGAILNFGSSTVAGATEQGSDGGERRRDDLLHQIDDKGPDQRCNPEFRIVDRAGDLRKIQRNPAVASLCEGDRQCDRQRHGLLAFGCRAKLQLIDHDVMRGVEPAILDAIMKIGRQLALLNAVTGVVA